MFSCSTPLSLLLSFLVGDHRPKASWVRLHPLIAGDILEDRTYAKEVRCQNCILRYGMWGTGFWKDAGIGHVLRSNVSSSLSHQEPKVAEFVFCGSQWTREKVAFPNSP